MSIRGFLLHDTVRTYWSEYLNIFATTNKSLFTLLKLITRSKYWLLYHCCRCSIDTTTWPIHSLTISNEHTPAKITSSPPITHHHYIIPLLVVVHYKYYNYNTTIIIITVYVVQYISQSHSPWVGFILDSSATTSLRAVYSSIPTLCVAQPLPWVSYGPSYARAAYTSVWKFRSVILFLVFSVEADF